MDPADTATKIVAGGISFGTAILFIRLLLTYQRTFLGDSVSEVKRLHERVEALEAKEQENGQEIHNLQDQLAKCQRNHDDANWQIGILKRQLAEAIEYRSPEERTRADDPPPGV